MNSTSPVKRFDYAELLSFVQLLFKKAGANDELAEIVSTTLIEGDLLGHYTHGVNLVGGYLSSILDGHAKVDTSLFQTLSSSGSSALYDGNYVLGPYCVTKALEFATNAATEQGIGIAVVRRSHHIGCLAAYLKVITDKGLIPFIYSSDPSVASVSAHGGIDPMFTPNPIAVGIPTQDAPILIDVSMSTLTNGFVNKARSLGEKLPHPALMSNEGKTTDDPEAFFTTPPGSILPLGGLEFGHKGFALGLMVEAMTSALGGHGRKDGPTAWGASVCVMAINPGFFAGIESFKEETSFLADKVLHSKPVDAQNPVRLPGASGLARREENLRNGVALPEFVIAQLSKAAEKLDVGSFPKSFSL